MADTKRGSPAVARGAEDTASAPVHLLGIYTGSRSSVILGLKWDQVDLERGIMLRRPRGEAEPRNKRTPPVRLGRRIISHLRRWRRQDDNRVSYVCHFEGRRLAKLKRSWPRAAGEAGLKDITPHILRHTRATWLMQRGVKTWEAAGHLGMSVAVLETVYGKHHPDWQKEAAEV